MASAALLSHLTRRGETLYERLADLEQAPTKRPTRDGLASPGATASSRQLLTGWCKAFARGRFEALTRRLAWEGWTPDQAAVAFRRAEDLSPATPALWTTALANYEEAARRLATEIAEGQCPEAAVWRRRASDVPFLELWIPWLQCAAEGLVPAGEETSWAAFEDSARADLEHSLLAEIAALSALAAYELFDTRRRADEDSSEGLYQRFVADTLEDPLTRFYTSFPALARRTAEIVRQWRDSVRELARRLRADGAAIAETFADGRPIGQVKAVLAALSDRHGDGRQVLIVEFESDLRLVYKPRDTGLEKALEGWLGWCRDQGFELCPRAPRVLPGDGYGWVEFIDHEGETSLAKARDYYRRAGALVAFAYVLRAQDLHAENLVATRQGPVVIDAEMFLQPIRSRFSTADASSTPISADGSCLDSGLLLEPGKGASGEIREWGGLRPQPMRRGLIGGGRKWRQIGRDDMHVEPAQVAGELGENVLRVGGEPTAPEDFRDDLAFGFEQAYRFLHGQRAELLSEEGPLRCYADTRPRILLRPSQEYGRVLTLVTLPRNQRSGLTESLLCEAMISVFSSADERPAMWPLVLAERTSLLAGDIPRFVADAETAQIRATSDDVSAGTSLASYFSVSGLDAVRQRIKALGEDDLRRQLELISLALNPPRTLTCLTIEPKDPRPATALDPEEFAARCRQTAWALGDELLADGGDIRLPEEASGISRGRLGIALLFAALARDSDEDRFARVARDLARHDAEAEHDLAGEPGLGGFSGHGSTLYGRTWLALLLGDPDLLASARAAVSRVDRESIRRDNVLDIEGGSAGLLLGLLACHQATGDTEALNLALVCGDHLLSKQRQLTSIGAAWPNSSGIAGTGWAHGTAGIARALTAVAEVAPKPQSERYRVAAAAALGYERGLFDAEQGNWPILGHGPDKQLQRSWFVAWCHGAPGIALSRLLLPPSFADAGLSNDLAAALQTTISAPPADVDHLCCGNLGRSAVLLTAGRRRRSAAHIGEARRLTATVLDRARAEGRFRLRNDRLATRISQPGFLKGLAGVGYHLLRLSSSAAGLPDVLALELPHEMETST